MASPNPHGDSGHWLPQHSRCDLLALAQTRQCIGQRNARSRDARGTSAAIGLKHITIYLPPLKRFLIHLLKRFYDNYYFL
jgi:hypothetical protein